MIPYIGGKSALSKWIIGEFPANYEKLTYVEVFGGGGWVLFRKNPSFIEVYNDLNSHLTTLFEVIRDNYKIFKHKAEWSLHSREMFNYALKILQDDKQFDEIEIALAKAIAQVQSFAGVGGNWGYSKVANRCIAGRWTPFLKRLMIINARLKKVQIENLDFEELIFKYDSGKALFYVDPPYVDTEKYYEKGGVSFSKQDHIRLANTLKQISGKFILSYYDHPLIRELYKEMKIIKRENVKHSVKTIASLNMKKPKGIELLIKNF